MYRAPKGPALRLLEEPNIHRGLFVNSSTIGLFLNFKDVHGKERIMLKLILVSKTLRD